MSKPKKLLLMILCLLLIAAAAFFIFYQKKEKRLEVIFLDVGQGDAILIKTPYDQQILIDGGPDNAILNELSHHLPFWDRTIDLVILTHPHSDHVDGLLPVLERYQVNKIFYTGVKSESPDYLLWLDKVEEKAIPMVAVSEKDAVNLGANLTLDILFPFQALTGQETEDLNNTSIVSRLIYGQNSFLLTGDLPAEQENEILEKKLVIDSDVLKVGHHGSKYSSSTAFLEAVSPIYSIIQVGTQNKFGHPHFLTLENFGKINTQIWRTDQDGAIKCLSNQLVLSCSSL